MDDGGGNALDDYARTDDDCDDVVDSQHVGRNYHGNDHVDGGSGGDDDTDDGNDGATPVVIMLARC